MPSDMLRDDDLIDDDYQGNAYAPFLQSSSGGTRRAASLPGTDRFIYALLGLVVLGAAGVHVLAPTGASVAVLQISIGVFVFSLLLIALVPRIAIATGIAALLSAYVGLIALVSYFAGYHS